jgi:hypothetical protein
MSSDLLSEIRTFLARTGMGPSYFGDLACGNTELVRRLESGGSVTLRTAEKIRAFMAARNNQSEPPAISLVPPPAGQLGAESSKASAPLSSPQINT